MNATASKVVLITGASAGLGAAVARELAGRGHRLALVARRADLLERVAEEIRSRGGTAACLPDDLADPGAPARIVEAVSRHFGTLDVLINNAGIGLPDFFGRSDPDALRRQVEVNLTAPLVLARLALPMLIESKGIVVNIGSGIVRLPNPSLGAYGATKAGLSYWTDALRRELRHLGVRVCLVELGPVETEFFDAVGRLEGGDRGLLGPTPAGFVYNAMRDRPPGLMMAPLSEAARRIAGLVDAPRPLLAVSRRVIWPVRLAGAFFGLLPVLADLAVSGMIRRVDRERPGPVPRRPEAPGTPPSPSPSPAEEEGASPQVMASRSDSR
ncbi:SDR family NAD(P)-dependent oxidoreductase [Tautonia sociabilis]|uniref:SDR family NAD(P)-dependent oxidoreductase n=1 Tax=Tautonia sociabilis TaxID=2080755 RepID=A0A432MJX5_9BACT|nr:SDR family NAD(P)-dependent oxidoreductase [Tautonia sociabilis]RUL87428.1 SDR family NAD(P)-dependent oxidoreductase [Tautonia sociabilis]